MGRTSRQGDLLKAPLMRTDKAEKARAGLPAHGDSTNSSEPGETETAPKPWSPPRLEGQALPLGARRPGRLAGPGLRRPSPSQAKAQPLSRARQEAGRPCRASGGNR